MHLYLDAHRAGSPRAGDPSLLWRRPHTPGSVAPSRVFSAFS